MSQLSNFPIIIFYNYFLWVCIYRELFKKNYSYLGTYVLPLNVRAKIPMKSAIPDENIYAGPEDGPEEGEIVSDDLEDISDDSISFTPCNGKSLSRSDHLNALSLSSITDLEEGILSEKHYRKRRKCYSQRHAKRRKRSSRKVVDSDSSDDDTTLDRRLKLQLKAAVRVDVEEVHKNSLRTRLKAMVQTASGLESDDGTTEQKLEEDDGHNSGSSDVLCLPGKDLGIVEIDSGSDSILEAIPTTSEIVVGATEAILSGSEHSRDDIDSELIQLRIEALKTAINNKFANRKRRKRDGIAPSDDTNKENNNNNNGTTQDKKTETLQISPQTSHEPEHDVPPSPEEDEDVLRALLLASMSKKITNTKPEAVKVTVQAKPVVVNFNKIAINKKSININNYKLNNIKKAVNNVNTGNTKFVKMPQVKPLIISVNSDSDSDLDLSSSPEKSPKKPQKSSSKETVVDNNLSKHWEAAIESSVDKFLREQRAKVESAVEMISKDSLASLKNVIETAKKDVKVQGTVTANKQITVNPLNITQKTVFTKTSNTNKLITKPNTQYIDNSALGNPKNIRLAELEKSALKFLPESKREEYKQLQNLLKLRKAQLKKPRVRRASQKVIDPKNLVNKNDSVGDKNGAIIKNRLQIKNKVASVKTNGAPIILSNKGMPVASVVPKEKLDNPNLVTKTVKNDRSVASVVPKEKLDNPKLETKNGKNDRSQKMEHSSQLSKIEARNQERRDEHIRVETHNEERKSDALLLHTTLKLMQTRKDGRLQIQERYKRLRPLIKKINDISKEQKHWDQEVKKLSEQLAAARKKQHEVHQGMSTFVKELAEKKQRMDESIANSSNKPKTNNVITSTPLRKNTIEPSLYLSAVDSFTPSLSLTLSITDQMSNINTKKALIDQIEDDSKKTEEMLQRNRKPKDMVNNTCEQSTKLNDNSSEISDVKRGVTDMELNVVDPNDIDKIIRKTEERVAVLEKKKSFECRWSEKVRYVSPLDSVKRKEEFDPFAIMCPFEVNGTCKDCECTFRHLPK